MQDADGRLLATVYWALSTLIGVTIAIAVLGWYVNFRVYERDQRALKDALASAVSLANADQIALIHRTVSAIQNQIQSAIDGKLLEAERLLRARSDENTAHLRYELTLLEYHFSELKGQTEEQMKSLLGAWFEYRTMLVTAIKLGESWPGYPLGHLKRILKAGVRLNHNHVLEITDLLRRVPSGYANDIETIQALVKAAQE